MRADIAAAQPYPADTYFGGKALYRDAQLIQIARQVGADDAAEQLTSKVTAELEKWMEPDGCQTRDAFCFFYDTRNHGLVGNVASFGSDEFNDHHFHYGYFLYAAGVLAADDPALAERIAPVMNLLAADIASFPASDFFVANRNFDPYQSHSWASGTAPFADGNNQESASEAVTAYAGPDAVGPRQRGRAVGGAGRLDARAGGGLGPGLLDRFRPGRSGVQGLRPHHHTADLRR